VTAFEGIGRATVRGAADVGTLTLQLSRVLLSLPRILPTTGNRRRWRGAVEQMLRIGAQALPMAATMSFCLGYVLALQSAAELRRFDALRFVVDLVAVAFTRELGALITALAVSGRSASAIAAEVGTMVVTEEIDALRVMGLDPVEFTLAPKYLGALITLPCLTVVSTFCGVFAGYLFLALSIDMSARIYFHQVVDSILLRDIWLTLIKSAVFATIVVQVGYMEGLRAHGGPEAVGRAATRAVVKATFFVIVTDLAATALFYAMGWSAAG
jgi:phospholipid/cholesterol/gamma-HCH transport system permease protein